MSINYNGPHPVDVPITDLDDDTDDIIFREQTGPTNANASRGTRLHSSDSGDEFLNSLDFENQYQRPGIFDKIKSYFHTRRFSGHYNAVTSDDNFEIGDDEEDDDDDEVATRFAHNLRDYKIKRLNAKLNKTIAIFVVGLVLTAGFIIFDKHWFRSHSGPNGNVALGANDKTVLSNSTHDFHPTTIMVSLDGFHPHYINPYLTPTLHNMMIHDFGAPYMVPSFPSSTFPNHWTLVTGLYPSEHGIVGNTFFDPTLKKQFINTNPAVGGLDPEFWQGGEPIWTTAFKQGVNSAVHMWPGSEVPGIGIDGGGPLYVDRYNGSELLSSKVNRVMTWLDIEQIDKRPELILTYVPTIDQFGHKFGISGSNLTDALKYVDDFVDLMTVELKRRNLNDIVNLIIVSDHGMAPTSNERLLFLDDLIDLNKIEHIDGWPLFGLRPFDKYSLDEVFNELQSKLDAIDKLKGHYRLFKLEDMPREWNFGGLPNEHTFNYRLAPIWIVPEVGYAITTHKQHKENNYDYRPKGVHGYNNTEVLMRATFLGSGPYFNKKLATMPDKKIRPFPNTEVYNLLCDTLNIKPSSNNGSSTKINMENGGSISSLFSPENALAEDWSDTLGYPGVTFPIDHIVNNATYDLLWNKPKDRVTPTTVFVSTNAHPYESLKSEESSLSSLTPESLPKPSDFSTVTSSETGKTIPTSNRLGDILENFEDALGNAGDSVEDALDNAGNALEDAFSDGLSDAGEDIADAVDSTMDKIHDWVGKIFGGGNKM